MLYKLGMLAQEKKMKPHPIKEVKELREVKEVALGNLVLEALEEKNWGQEAIKWVKLKIEGYLELKVMETTAEAEAVV